MNDLGPRCDLCVNRCADRVARGEPVGMTVQTATVADGLVLSRGPVRIEISRRPFAIDVRRDGAGSSAASGSGAPTARSPTSSSSSPRASSPPRSSRSPSASCPRRSPSRSPTASTSRCASTAAGAGGCGSRCRSPTACGSSSSSRARRCARRVGWDARAEEHFAGLGARHALRVDHAGRAIQLGADRAYTGPDCPPDMLDDRRDPAGRLRAGALAAVLARLRRPRRRPRQRDALRARRRAHDGLGAQQRRPAAR